MPERCVAALCNNVTDPENNISLHRIPFFGETCPIKQRRWNRWLNFVLERRKNWVPRKTSSLCSAHFTEDDFMRPLNLGAVKIKRELKRDQSGICVFPSRHISRENCEEVPSKKSREQRMVSHFACHLQHMLQASIFCYFVAPVFIDLVLSFMRQIVVFILLLFWFILIDREICKGKTEGSLYTREHRRYRGRAYCYFRPFYKQRGGK